MSHEDAMRALNRVAKWRTVYTGWQLGTRAKGDPEADAIRDAAEARILMRVELSALSSLLIRKGVITEDEWHDQLMLEAMELDDALATAFPGFTSSDIGMAMSAKAAETMKGWLP